MTDPIASSPESTLALIDRFNERFNAHDIDGFMALMSEDVLFENTWPSPDGERYEGREAVRGFWERFFAGSPSAHFDAEDIFATVDRCTVRWRYTWRGDDGVEGHVRGVDVFRVVDGKITEKLAYVKG